MSVLDEYIARAAHALRTPDGDDVDALCREISDVLKPAYTPARAWACLGSNEEFRYSATDLKRMLDLLRLRREEQDKETYGSSGLLTITQHIRLLEQAEEDGVCGDALKAVYDKVDSIYANYYGSYIDGLTSYISRDYETCSEQTTLRIEKLKHFRDDEMRKLRVAEARTTNVSMVQENNQTASANATSDVRVTIEATFEQIESIPDDRLSEDNKTLLKGMIADLNTNDKKKRDGKLKKLMGWLADKGADAVIAAMPYVVQIIQSWVA